MLHAAGCMRIALGTYPCGTYPCGTVGSALTRPRRTRRAAPGEPQDNPWNNPSVVVKNNPPALAQGLLHVANTVGKVLGMLDGHGLVGMDPAAQLANKKTRNRT